MSDDTFVPSAVVLATERAGELTITKPGVVINMPLAYVARRASVVNRLSSLRLAALGLGLAAGIALAPGHAGQAGGREFVISVPGIPGPYCAYGIEKRLRDVRGIERVELLWNDEQVKAVVAPGRTVTAAEIREAVERSEYPYRYRVEP